MSKSNRFILATIFLLASAGFLLQFWPLEALAVVLAALTGHSIFAIALGALLDIAYGAPLGLARFLFFPFTLLALLGIGVKRIGFKYLMGKRPPEHL